MWWKAQDHVASIWGLSPWTLTLSPSRILTHWDCRPTKISGILTLSNHVWRNYTVSSLLDMVAITQLYITQHGVGGQICYSNILSIYNFVVEVGTIGMMSSQAQLKSNFCECSMVTYSNVALFLLPILPLCWEVLHQHYAGTFRMSTQGVMGGFGACKFWVTELPFTGSDNKMICPCWEMIEECYKCVICRSK